MRVYEGGGDLGLSKVCIPFGTGRSKVPPVLQNFVIREYFCSKFCSTNGYQTRLFVGGTANEEAGTKRLSKDQEVNSSRLKLVGID